MLEDLGPFMFRQGYNNNLRRGTFPDIKQSAFTGDSDGWTTTYVDLSEFLGSSSLFQFRFATDDVRNSDFWVIDDFTVFDALTYNSEACLTYDGSIDLICTEASEWGTIVEPEEFTSTEEIAGSEASLKVYPNPTSDILNLEFNGVHGETRIRITDMNGRSMFVQDIDRIQDQSRFSVSMANWSSGLYLVHMTAGENEVKKKIFKR